MPDDVVRPRLAANLARAGDCLSRGRARPHPAPAAIPRFPNRPGPAGRSARRHGVRSLRARMVGSAGRCRRGVEGDPRSRAAALARPPPLILRPWTAPTPQAPPRASHLAGYLLALAAGATWGTTGPLSTGLYALMPATSIGFWRVLLGTVCLAAWGLLFYRELFRVDRPGWLLVGLGGGVLVALFEVAYQSAIAGAGVAGAAAMLSTAPVSVAILARLILKEALTPVRLLLSLLVMAGVALTVTGGSNAGAEAARLGLGAGIAGGLLSAVSYALTTLMARFAVPRYGAVRVLFLEAIGGVVILGIVLTLAGRAPTPPPSLAAWRGLVALTAGSVLAANPFFFLAGGKKWGGAPRPSRAHSFTVGIRSIAPQYHH